MFCKLGIQWRKQIRHARAFHFRKAGFIPALEMDGQKNMLVKML